MIEIDWTRFVSFDKYLHCEAAPNRRHASPSIGPWIKHIKPVLILLRPDPRKPETLKPGYFWLHWNQLEVLAKGFRPAGEFCGHLPALRIDTVYCQQGLQVVERNDFRGLLQPRVQSLKNGNIPEHWFARLDQKLKTRHGKCPECYFLTWENDLSWFICPHPQDFSEFPRQNAAVASQAERLTTGPRRRATARWWASCAQPLGSRSGAMTKINHHGSHISH